MRELVLVLTLLSALSWDLSAEVKSRLVAGSYSRDTLTNVLSLRFRSIQVTEFSWGGPISGALAELETASAAGGLPPVEFVPLAGVDLNKNISIKVTDVSLSKLLYYVATMGELEYGPAVRNIILYPKSTNQVSILEARRTWTSKRGTARLGKYIDYDPISHRVTIDFFADTGSNQRAEVKLIDLAKNDQDFVKTLYQYQQQSKAAAQRAAASKTAAAAVAAAVDKIVTVDLPPAHHWDRHDISGERNSFTSAIYTNYRTDKKLSLNAWKRGEVDRRRLPVLHHEGFRGYDSGALAAFYCWWDEIGFVKNPRSGDSDRVIDWLKRKLTSNYEVIEYLEDCEIAPAVVAEFRGNVTLSFLSEVTQGIDITILNVTVVERGRMKWRNPSTLLTASPNGRIVFSMWGKRFDGDLVEAPPEMQKEDIRWLITNVPKGLSPDVDSGENQLCLTDSAVTVISPFFR